MISSDLAASSYVGDLGGGLIRRWSSAADTEKIAQLVGTVFRDHNDPLPNPGPMAEARLMLGPGFPYMTPDDAAVVEDTSKPGRPLVACTYLWRHRWSYAGIPFDVTRPEIVVSHPDYRRRGLVRAIFEMIHARGAAEGHLMQAITGIGYFYRQFGYDYILDLDGSRTTYLSLIPEQKDDVPEPCSFRVATVDDIPDLVAIYNRRRAGSLVWHEAPAAYWRYVIDVWNAAESREQDTYEIGMKGRYWVIANASGAVCGYCWLPTKRWSSTLSINALEFAERANVSAQLPAVLRWLREQAARIPAARPDFPPCNAIAFALGRAHPVYSLLGDSLAPRVEPPYAWYIRVPDLPAFLRRITPELERRLAQSVLAGFSGVVKIDLYREALILRLTQGKLGSIERSSSPIQDGDEERALGCPPLSFPQLVLGYRDLDEMRAIYPDVEVRDDKRLLLETLFPKLPSIVDPLG